MAGIRMLWGPRPPRHGVSVHEALSVGPESPGLSPQFQSGAGGRSRAAGCPHSRVAVPAGPLAWEQPLRGGCDRGRGFPLAGSSASLRQEWPSEGPEEELGELWGQLVLPPTPAVPFFVISSTRIHPLSLSLLICEMGVKAPPLILLAWFSGPSHTGGS